MKTQYKCLTLFVLALMALTLFNYGIAKEGVISSSMSYSSGSQSIDVKIPWGQSGNHYTVRITQTGLEGNVFSNVTYSIKGNNLTVTMKTNQTLIAQLKDAYTLPTTKKCTDIQKYYGLAEKVPTCAELPAILKPFNDGTLTTTASKTSGSADIKGATTTVTFTDIKAHDVYKIGSGTITIYIFINDAWHLDSTRSIITNIYNQTSILDNNTYTIPSGDYARVQFTQNLSSGNDIMMYANGTGTVDVYESYSNTYLGSMTIGSFGVYDFRLTNLTGQSDLFDIKSNGAKTYDFIVDPPTAITTCAGLQNMNNDVTADYYLANDIDCAGTNFKPVGGNAYSDFSGNFDGKNHTISNLYISNQSAAVGLFGVGQSCTLGTGYIRNFGLVNVSIYPTATVRAGAVVGLDYCHEISQVYVTGTLYSTTAGTDGVAGMIGAGLANSYLYHDLWANMTITGPAVGGISGNYASLNRTYFIGILNSTSDGANSGGLFGGDGGYSSGTANSFAAAKVYSTGAGAVGGFSGNSHNQGVQQSFWFDWTTDDATTASAGGDYAGTTKVNTPTNDPSYFYTMTNNPMSNWSTGIWDSACSGVKFPHFIWENACAGVSQPVVTLQPASIAKTAGQPLTINGTCTSSGTLSYAWMNDSYFGNVYDNTPAIFNFTNTSALLPPQTVNVWCNDTSNNVGFATMTITNAFVCQYYMFTNSTDGSTGQNLTTISFCTGNTNVINLNASGKVNVTTNISLGNNWTEGTTASGNLTRWNSTGVAVWCMNQKGQVGSAC